MIIMINAENHLSKLKLKIVQSQLDKGDLITEDSSKFSVAGGQDQVDWDLFSARTHTWNRDSRLFLDKEHRYSKSKMI